MVKVKRWTLVAFDHPNSEHSLYYRKNIVHIDRAVKRAEELGANLMSIRAFEVEIAETSKTPVADGDQQILGDD